jgi:hypothetical protein
MQYISVSETMLQFVCGRFIRGNSNANSGFNHPITDSIAPDA